MAESAVKLAANWMGKILVEEGKYLWGVENKVTELWKELVWMQCFLRDAECLQFEDEIVAQWVLEIKEHVYEAEDIVDKFVIQVASKRRLPGRMNKLKRWSRIGMELFAMHQVASSVDSLIRKISKLTPKLQTYGLKTAYGMKTYENREALLEQTQQRMSYVNLDTKNIVGLDQDTEMIINALLDSEVERRVVGIYGMGGLGKTTLITKVYNDKRIKKHFTGGCAWAYISKQLQRRNVLQIILADLTSKPDDTITVRSTKDLINDLREFLQKHKCLVVLDDVWKTEDWDFLYDAFPESGVESGSRFLLTTRKEEVALYADHHALPKPDPLNYDTSCELLQQTLGWRVDSNGEKGDAENNNATDISENTEGVNVTDGGANKLESLLTEMFGSNGEEVIKQGKAMLKHCNGIPLAIVVLGGILKKKQTVEEWRLVRENITSYLRRGNDHGKSYMEVLVLSYNDLPYHLKPCFLHLGNFPANYDIHTEKLYRMWVAEGLVVWPRDRVAGTESLEDVANDYMFELAQAGMVQIKEKGSKGRIKSVRIHDLMRDVCLQKAVTSNFLSIIDHRSCPDEPQSFASSSNHWRMLRMAIYLSQDVKKYLPDSLFTNAHEYLRSLMFFPARGVQEGSYAQWIEDIFNDFTWLRVMDIEGLRLKGRLTKNVQQVMHLRYLSLKDTDVFELPSSIGNLKFLQTLDIRVSSAGFPVRIPNTLWKLERLRHLFLPKRAYEIKKCGLLRLDTLSCLETLKNLELCTSRIEDLLKLKRLRKLSIKDVVSELKSIEIIAKSPAHKTGNLRGFSLRVKGSVIDDVSGILPSFSCLDQLRIVDKVSALKHSSLPLSLEVIRLESCQLDSDPMRILGSLRHLRDLKLGSNSYVGKQVYCPEESFPQLAVLKLRGLAKLEDWTMRKKCMPRLKKLIIMDCGKLKSLPEDLPLSVFITCSPCINGIEKYSTCICSRGTSLSVFDKEGDFFVLSEETGKSLVTLLDSKDKVVLAKACGLSKASLANMLYERQEIKTRFNALAWARCPHRRTTDSTSVPKHFIMGLLRQLAPESVDKNSFQKSLDTITAELEQVIQTKKSLIVLTDMTDFLQDPYMIFLSNIPNIKLLITSQEQSSGSVSNQLFIHDMIPLSDDDSLALFQKRLGTVMSGFDVDGAIKNELGSSMIKHCSNKPLSITMLSGLLAMKQTPLEWQSIQKELDSRMKKAQGPEPINIMHALSYDDLPPHLKNCFLYLSILPNDVEISLRKLTRLWIGAGFVKLKDGEAEAIDLLENVAESYLNELVIRGLVQVGKRGPNGRISTCYVHIVMHSLCSIKATEERFVTEHLAVHFDHGGEQILKDIASESEQLRSLLFFPKINDIDNGAPGEYNWDSFIKYCNKFRLLRVLDLEGMWKYRGMLPTEIGSLFQLRYLSLRGTRVNELPTTIQNLTNLKTLDLRVEESLLIPDLLFNFQHLRHLHLPDSITQRPFNLKLEGLNHLRTLANLNTEHVDLDCLPKLKNLMRISVRNIHQVNVFDAKYKAISTHAYVTLNSRIFEGNARILSDFQNLHKLAIKGEISMPLTVGMFPNCIKDLTLKHTKLKQDIVPVLGKLPGLKRLFLDHESFTGKKITFTRGSFPQLTYLKLRYLGNLEELDMTEAEHLSRLQKPDVKHCWQLKITGMQFVTPSIP
ncbi:hypothetical protein V2J09_001819 [Rumex salicifolius]